jgi:hypothetical protein
MQGFGTRDLALALILVGALVQTSAIASAQPAPAPTRTQPAPAPTRTPVGPPKPTPTQQTPGYLGGPKGSNEVQEEQLKNVMQQPGTAGGHGNQHGVKPGQPAGHSPQAYRAGSQAHQGAHHRTMNFRSDNSADELNGQELSRLSGSYPNSPRP